MFTKGIVYKMCTNGCLKQIHVTNLVDLGYDWMDRSRGFFLQMSFSKSDDKSRTLSVLCIHVCNCFQAGALSSKTTGQRYREVSWRRISLIATSARLEQSFPSEFLTFIERNKYITINVHPTWKIYL